MDNNHSVFCAFSTALPAFFSFIVLGVVTVCSSKPNVFCQDRVLEHTVRTFLPVKIRPHAVSPLRAPGKQSAGTFRLQITTKVRSKRLTRMARS